MKKDKIIEARYGSPDKPLKIGNAEIPCYVLKDGRRVITQAGLIEALGMARGSAGKEGDRLGNFIGQSRFNGLIDSKILSAITNPILFKPMGAGGSGAYGYEGTILVDICDAIIQAEKNGKLQKQQKHIADQASMLLRSFAKTGIIALIDEATGYQKDRDRDALQMFFNKALQEEQAEWVLTFKDEFFEMIFKMKGWTWHYASTKKPQVIGHYINDFVYDRIAPELAKELKQLAKDKKTGNRKGKLHQHLTPDYGHPKLTEHLSALTALGRASGYNWNNFKRFLERAFPKFNKDGSMDLKLPFADEDEE